MRKMPERIKSAIAAAKKKFVKYIPEGRRTRPCGHNISERKRVEAELRKSDQRVASILESLTDGFFSLTHQWRFAYANATAERIIGIGRKELYGKTFGEVFPEEKNEKMLEACQRCMAYKMTASFEVFFEQANKWMDVHCYPYEDGISVYLKDISERKLSEERLRQAQSRLDAARRLSDIGTLAATIAHELRNPLAAIRVATFNIKRKAQNPELEKHLANIDKKVFESDQIINNLLFYSRLKQPHYEPTDLYKILDECLEIAQKRAKQENISVSKGYRILLRQSVEADSLQMKELFCNILNNAYEAMQGQPYGRVEIKASRGENGSELIISVKDTGIGMDAEHLKQVYEPFFTTKSKGTGLGLTVCFQIMNLHHGRIEITSQKGKGTVVSVALPVKRTV